jgi:hypothetical protein
MSLPFIIKFAESTQELEQILVLQNKNLVEHVTIPNRQTNGFVTVKHDLALLKQMCEAAQQIIAKENNEVIAYALAMPKEFSVLVPVLQPMFSMFEKLSFGHRPLNKISYYVMGQICIAEHARGKGIFEQLYLKHKETYANKFDLCLTEVSSSNPRSMKAHEKVGFRTIHNFDDQTDNWNILAWDWN